MDLEKRIEKLKEIIRWQSLTMANMKPHKKKKKKEVEDGKGI